ncbi:hypothetical protein Bca4012_088136 [Brassica carinata]|uniref:Uncharacterized protein n=1 Tax=Brassica carinata TaxID=52824 RepID=A0A8X7PCY3_BRACI|nr:hypothetical protein Bca52824_088200 [Brassica carinata]
MRFDVGESKEGSGMANEAVFFSNLFSEWDCTPSPASSRPPPSPCTSATRPPHNISKMVSKRPMSLKSIFVVFLIKLFSNVDSECWCQGASFVRMVTGDNVQTARAIALECGILTSDADASEPNLGMGACIRLNMKPHENWKQLFSIKKRQ